MPFLLSPVLASHLEVQASFNSFTITHCSCVSLPIRIDTARVPHRCPGSADDLVPAAGAQAATPSQTASQSAPSLASTHKCSFAAFWAKRVDMGCARVNGARTASTALFDGELTASCVDSAVLSANLVWSQSRKRPGGQMVLATCATGMK